MFVPYSRKTGISLCIERQKNLKSIRTPVSKGPGAQCAWALELVALGMELDERGEVALRGRRPADCPHPAAGNGGNSGEAAVPATRRVRDGDQGKSTVDSLQYQRVVIAGCGIDSPPDHPGRAVVGDRDSEGIVLTSTEGWG